MELLSIRDKSLITIAKKINNSERLSLEDGITLYQSNDLHTIANLANKVNQKINGDNVYFIDTMYINPTNVCEARCEFCGYRRDLGEEGSYTMNKDELLDYVGKRFNENIREFHITGGHNSYENFDYYVNTIKTLKEHYPDVTIKAYDGAEIVFLSKISGLSVEKVLKILIDAGVETLPGGGAEILVEDYRKKLSPDKATSDEWLNAHETAHKMGLKTHSTMLYGSIETIENRITHMLRLRELQDKYHGFQVFIPLALQPKKKTASLKMRTSAFDDLKTIAISRLMLDNFPHIKAYWIDIGPQLTQVALHYGASDVHGTIVEERISHAVAATTSAGLSREEIIWLIKTSNKTPIERDTFYNVIKTF